MANKLIQISDAGDSYTFSTRAYMSFTVSKVAFESAKFDVAEAVAAQIEQETIRALKLAVSQIPEEMAKLRKAAEAEAA